MDDPDPFVYDSPLNNTRIFSGEMQQIPDRSILYTRIPSKNGVIALMNHPASLTVYQHVLIRVISGSVSVFGYEINPCSTKSLKVFSSENTGLVEVKTESYDIIWKKRKDFQSLADKFNVITEDEEKTNDVMTQLGNYTVVVYIERCAKTVDLQFLELYFPRAFQFDVYKEKRSNSYIDKAKTSSTPIHFGSKDVCKKKKPKLYIDRLKAASFTPIRFDQNVDVLAIKIIQYIRSAKLSEIDAPRIVVCGPKNSGKSSLIRYFINRMLSTFYSACYLDADPGQSEFTPPGTVSLTEVKNPIIGPPFCHLRKPISMIFTGSVSPTSPDLYSKSVSKLMQLYDSCYKRIPLFVNTMGWMEGFGLHCLETVVTIAKPTILVEIVMDEDNSMFDYREYMPEDSEYVQLCFSHKQKNPVFSAKDMREMTLLSYFGKAQSMYLGVLPVTELRPYCVSWDEIPVYLSHQKVQPYRLIEAINQSIVALCAVSESAILESDIPQFPKTLEDEPDHECIGFGLVRAVDEKAHLLYIVTPLKLKDIKRVNAIIKGDVQVPKVLLLDQEVYEEPLPFTNERDVLPPTNDIEMKDISKVSLLPSDTEYFASDITAQGSVEHYRKPITPRHRRKLHH